MRVQSTVRDSVPDSFLVHHQWASLIPDEQWNLYKIGIDCVRGAGVDFMLGGAFALASYTGRWRNTKDLDLYIRPSDREQAIARLAGAGFTDYYAELPYDRRWIFRMTREGVIVDLIWAMANQRAQVDKGWFAHAPTVPLRDESLHVLPPEALLWCKLYVLQRDRCDWPDLINLLYATGPHLDWERVLAQMDQELGLLTGLLHVFTWLCPDRARMLPKELREQFHLRAGSPGADTQALERHRVELLDSRPWFAAFEPVDVPMKL